MSEERVDMKKDETIRSLEELALHRFKNSDRSKAISHEEMKKRFAEKVRGGKKSGTEPACS